MESLCRFFVRLDVRVGLAVAWIVISLTMGMLDGFIFAGICATVGWYARTALGTSARPLPAPPPPPLQEDYVHVAAKSAARAPASIDKMDPAWREWLKRESDRRPEI
jgi:hypothetical protein